ncbi:hypothetical protein [Mesorhizobium sp. J428]|uniref:hypothetical protein n=1 Tax=Mesorhizobium sp. J428 TaxID=2898440 RepID=UPI0021514035|nr:hypothetical protein [Mesorhizobium sp. J428]MCR5857883.1 hypothetical protein [Mesorhizobium sp. J428]
MARRRSAILAWTLLTTSLAGAQEAGQTIALPYQPAIGTDYSVVIVRTKTVTKNEISNRIEAKIVARLQIQEETTDGYLAEWETKSIEVGSVSIVEQPDLFVGVPIQVELAADGTPISIPGWSGVRQRIATTLRQRQATDDATLKLVEALMQNWSEDMAASALLPELAIAALCQGTELSLGQPISSTYELPNMLGGMPFEAKGTYSLASIDEAADLAHISWRQDVDESQFTDIIRQSMNSIRQQKGLADDNSDFAAKRRDAADCKVRMSSGMVEEIHHVAAVETTSAETTETRTDERRVEISLSNP